MQSQRNQRGAWGVWHRSISYHRSLVCAIRCDSPLRRPAQPVPVGQRQDPAPRECFFDGGGHRVWRCRRLPDPDASGELLCQVSGGRVHDVEELLQGGAAVDAVRGPALRGERDGDRHRLRRGEVDRWQGRRRVQDVTAPGIGLRRHRQPGLLQRDHIALDRPGTHLQPPGHPGRGTPTRAGVPQFLGQRVQPVGAIHTTNSDRDGDRPMSPRHRQN